MKNKKVLWKDSEWSIIDGEPCKVIDFTPLASVQNGKVVAPNLTDPYASVTLECKKIPSPAKGFITNKMDFAHLWAAFKEQGVSENEEVIIIWTTKHYKYKFVKFLSAAFPKMWVMICRKGTLKIRSSNWPTNLIEWADANGVKLISKPIAEWKPEIIK